MTSVVLTVLCLQAPVCQFAGLMQCVCVNRQRRMKCALRRQTNGRWSYFNGPQDGATHVSSSDWCSLDVCVVRPVPVQPRWHHSPIISLTFPLASFCFSFTSSVVPCETFFSLHFRCWRCCHDSVVACVSAALFTDWWGAAFYLRLQPICCICPTLRFCTPIVDMFCCQDVIPAICCTSLLHHVTTPCY